jgi:hypothetical protein
MNINCPRVSWRVSNEDDSEKEHALGHAPKVLLHADARKKLVAITVAQEDITRGISPTFEDSYDCSSEEDDDITMRPNKPPPPIVPPNMSPFQYPPVQISRFLPSVSAQASIPVQSLSARANPAFASHLCRKPTSFSECTPYPQTFPLRSDPPSFSQSDGYQGDRVQKMKCHGFPNNTVTVIDEPTTNDVLLGRGKFAQYHPGNIQVRQIAEEWRDCYDASEENSIKSSILAQILGIVQNEKRGRFLERFYGDDGREGWIEIDDHRAREKVALVFRSMRRRIKELSREVDIVKSDWWQKKQGRSKSNSKTERTESFVVTAVEKEGGKEENMVITSLQSGQAGARGDGKDDSISIKPRRKRDAVSILRQNRPLDRKEKQNQNVEQMSTPAGQSAIAIKERTQSSRRRQLPLHRTSAPLSPSTTPIHSAEASAEGPLCGK